MNPAILISVMYCLWFIGGGGGGWISLWSHAVESRWWSTCEWFSVWPCWEQRWFASAAMCVDLVALSLWSMPSRGDVGSEVYICSALRDHFPKMCVFVSHPAAGDDILGLLASSSPGDVLCHSCCSIGWRCRGPWWWLYLHLLDE